MLAESGENKGRQLDRIPDCANRRLSLFVRLLVRVLLTLRKVCGDLTVLLDLWRIEQ